MNLSVQIEIVKGPARGKVFHRLLAAGRELVIGREQGVEIWLPRTMVSRRHCKLANRDGRLVLEDGGSLNGTVLDGVVVKGQAEVAPDSVLVVGPFHLRVSVYPEDSPFFAPPEDMEELLHGVTPPPGKDVETMSTGAFPALSPYVGMALGGYQVHHSLGEGGMSEVFQGQREADGVQVAIKILTGRPSVDRIERFQREAKLLAALDHPRILRLLDQGAQDGTYYLVTELLHGETLEAVLLRKRSFEPRLAVVIAGQIAEALAHAADRNIIHRDVTPKNVFVHASGDEVGVKVIDFGLGKDVAGGAVNTAVGEGMGTLGYMAPEQLDRARDADWRSDIYGLGATLYRMLAGRPPRMARSLAEYMRSIREEAPARVGGVPEPLTRLVERCLAVEPSARWRNYRELLAELSRVQGSLQGLL